MTFPLIDTSRRPTTDACPFPQTKALLGIASGAVVLNASAATYYAIAVTRRGKRKRVTKRLESYADIRVGDTITLYTERGCDLVIAVDRVWDASKYVAVLEGVMSVYELPSSYYRFYGRASEETLIRTNDHDLANVFANRMVRTHASWWDVASVDVIVAGTDMRIYDYDHGLSIPGTLPSHVMRIAAGPYYEFVGAVAPGNAETNTLFVINATDVARFDHAPQPLYDAIVAYTERRLARQRTR